MMMIRLAWRNIWRQKRRSMVALLALIVGGGVAMFTDAWSLGMIRQLIESQIMLGEGLASVRSKHWVQGEETARNAFERDATFETSMKHNNVYVAPSLSVEAMVSSSYNSSGLILKGIELGSQRDVNSALAQITLSATEFAPGTVILSQWTADLLQVSIGDRIVVMTNAADSSLVSMSARVAAVFETHSSGYDKGTAFVPLSDLQQCILSTNSISEYVLRPHNMRLDSDVQTILDQYDTNNTQIHVYSFDDMFPMLVYQRDSTREMMWVFYAIIGVAVFFGIANAMSMAVIERTKEIGMMKAIGMQPLPVWSMFLTESLLLGIVGTLGAIGLFTFVDLIVFPSGIDLSAFSEGLSAFGMSSAIELEIDEVTLLSMMWLPLCAVAGTIAPATKIARMLPLEALKHE